jgi:hypothetical protein
MTFPHLLKYFTTVLDQDLSIKVLLSDDKAMSSSILANNNMKAQPTFFSSLVGWVRDLNYRSFFALIF